MSVLIAHRAAAVGLVAVTIAAHANVVGPADVPAINGVAPATTLQVNPGGIGHMLLVPYYSVQAGNDTYLSIANTDTLSGKAVKVRFRGAGNGDTVFDFTLLLSPGDMWTAAVTRDAATGLAKLITVDRSCSLPAGLSGRTFSQQRLGQAPGEENALLSADTKAGQAREGLIEIITLADIPPRPLTEPPSSLFQDIRQVGGIPRNCASDRVNALQFDPIDYAGALAKGLAVPTTGLAANWTLINVPLASSHTGGATAIEARVAAGGRAGYGNIVLFPQTAASVDLINTRRYTADPLLRGGMADNTTTSGAPNLPAVTALMSDLPDLSTPYVNAELANLERGVAAKRQASQLSAALAVTSINNEYVTDASILAVTDWTIAMPTKRYSVARDYRIADPAFGGATVFTNLTRDDAAAPSATIGGSMNWFSPLNTYQFSTHQWGCSVVGTIGEDLSAENPSASNRHGAVIYDREARNYNFVLQPFFPPAPCGAVAVFAINATIGFASTLGASVTRQEVFANMADGWWRFSTLGLHGVANVAGPAGVGLPIIGGALMRFTNNSVAPNVSGNYGTYMPHRWSVD